MKIDADALNTVLTKYAEERLAKDLREVVIYGLPPEFGELYKAYQDEVERKRKATVLHIEVARMILLYAMSLGCIAYGTYSLIK